MEFKINDEVVVVDRKYAYDSYENMILIMKERGYISEKQFIKNKFVNVGNVGVIKGICKHENSDEIIALIECYDEDRCILVGIKSLLLKNTVDVCQLKKEVEIKRLKDLENEISMDRYFSIIDKGIEVANKIIKEIGEDSMGIAIFQNRMKSWANNNMVLDFTHDLIREYPHREKEIIKRYIALVSEGKKLEDSLIR